MFSLNEQRAIELGEAGEKAVREQDEYSALQNIEYLREFGQELLEANFESDLKRVIISIRNIGSKGIQKKMDNVTSASLTCLKLCQKLPWKKIFLMLYGLFQKLYRKSEKGLYSSSCLNPQKKLLIRLKLSGWEL